MDGSTALTTQTHFDEDVTAAVYESAPYSQHTGRHASNATDGIFDAANVLRLSKDANGHLGVITFGVNP